MKYIIDSVIFQERGEQLLNSSFWQNGSISQQRQYSAPVEFNDGEMRIRHED